MKPKHSTGYLTPQANKTKHNSKLKRTGSNENLSVAKDLSDSFFQKLMNCPLKRQLVLNLIKSERDNIEAYKRNRTKEDKRKEDTASSLSKIKRNYQCESPTALLRRRALQQQNRQNIPENQEKNESNSTSRSSSRQSSVSSCSSPIPFDKLLDGVISYVEIKSKDQDRSSAVKALMKSMGATVRDTFTKDVTHVVFKDGSFTTYQKAILMKVHLVSVLWIEAVRSNNMRVSEKKFPALGTETYDNNVSSICSQLQKEYEGIIRDELHRSLITGTPLPSTQTLIDRRRTIMTPSSGRFSQEFVSSQDKEVDKILHSHTKTSGNYLTEELAADFPSDDDSDIGPFINGRNIRRRSNSPSHNILESNTNLNHDIEESNMDLTFLEGKTPPKDNGEFKKKNSSLSKRVAVSDHLQISNNSFCGDAKENCVPHSSDEDICYRKTPKLKKTITNLRSKSEGENEFSIPNDDTYKRTTRILRSNSQSRWKANRNGSSTNMSVLESSDKSSDLQILSKNVCVINVNVNNTALNNISNTTSNATVDKSSSTNMSSLQISSNKRNSGIEKANEIAGISTSTDLSTLMISSNSSKAKSINIDQKIRDNNGGLEADLNKESTRERTSLTSKDSFSPINPAVIKDVLETLDSIPVQEENITKRRKKHSVEKRKIYNTRRRTISHAEFDKTESDQNTEDNSASSISPQSKVYNLLPKKDTNTFSKGKSIKIQKSKKTEHVPLSDSFSNLQITARNENGKDKKKTASENRPLKRSNSTNVAKQVEDDSKSSNSSQGSSQSNGSGKKLNKTRKLYDPNESVKEIIITNDQSERECRRDEVQKRKSNEAAAVHCSNIVTISPNTLLTTKAKKFVDQNNIDFKAILNKESESEDKVAKKRKTKRNVEKNLNNSDGDEQHRLAEEFLNKQNDMVPKKSAKESTTKKQEVIRRRKSARLTQYSKKKLKFDGSTTSSDEGNIVPVTPVINRRSTMEFQTKSQMSSNKKLKIDKTKRPSIVCTKLHKEDNQIFNQIVRKLGGFVIEDEVSRKTTHLVAGEPKRTINMLRAMTMGCWILKHEWLLRSLEERRWLPEEDYEETDFSPAVQQCRLQRQAFGPSYTMDVFQECGPIYIAKGTTPRCSDLQELVLLCKGIICSIPRNAAIVVGEYFRYEGVKCVKEAWVLDSITFNKKMRLKKYIITPSNHSPVV